MFFFLGGRGGGGRKTFIIQFFQMYIFTLNQYFLAFNNDQAVMKRIADDDNFSFHKCMFGLYNLYVQFFFHIV